MLLIVKLLVKLYTTWTVLKPKHSITKIIWLILCYILFSWYKKCDATLQRFTYGECIRMTLVYWPMSSTYWRWMRVRGQREPLAEERLTDSAWQLSTSRDDKYLATPSLHYPFRSPFADRYLSPSLQTCNMVHFFFAFSCMLYFQIRSAVFDIQYRCLE